MIAIDHMAVPPPDPAIPILASDLLAIEEKQRQRFSARGDRIRTGCAEIDDYMLRGGLERGVVVGISAEAGEGRLISLHFLSSLLLSQLSTSSSSLQPSKTRAAVIDTTGSFPISLLAQILKSRISESRTRTARQAVNHGNYAAGEDGEGKEVDDQVRRCLEMVAISRVFDVEGLWEVLDEAGRDPASSLQSDENTNDEGIEMVIIDKTTSLINELFVRKGKSEAHTLLTTLSRALHTLTNTLNIITILHNTTVSSTNKTYQPDPSIESWYQNQRKQPNQNPQPASIFPSNPLKPALGQIFSQLPDLHLLMSAMPKTREDAQQLYGQDDEHASGDSCQRDGGHCYVVEVLKDETPNLGSQSEKEKDQRKFGSREQRWAAVEMSGDGLGLVDAFMAKGNMRGLKMEREERGMQDVGSVAKLHGFGGRRV